MRDDAPIVPLTIGPANAERALGVPWRWVRDFARRAGVPILRVGGKSMVQAGPLLAALEREGLHVAAETETDLDARSELARRLG